MPFDQQGRLLCTHCGSTMMRYEARDQRERPMVVFSCIRCTDGDLISVPASRIGYLQPQQLG